MNALTPELAGQFARLTLGHVERQWPYKLDHVMSGPEDVKPPIALHPIFHGSFDWHSCVHGWWQLMRLKRRFPMLAEVPEIRARADRLITRENAAGELAYLARPESAGFERPYGWAWLLALHAELVWHEETRWAEAIEPLARAFADRFRAFLPKLTYPIRTGTHFNTSFALVLAHHWANAHDLPLAAKIEARALDWFAGDRDCQAWEPGGDEFLSPALSEALLMSRVLPRDEFRAWFRRFLPRLPEGEPATLLTPAHVSDRSDGKIAHLDGLNLSRAWCWRALGGQLAWLRSAHAQAMDAAERHIAASLPHLEDDYMGSHWLASFALLALDGA